MQYYDCTTKNNYIGIEFFQMINLMNVPGENSGEIFFVRFLTKKIYYSNKES